MRNTLFSMLAFTTMMLAASLASPVIAHCPFCSAINLTFADQIKKNDLVVIAKVTDIPPLPQDIGAELPKSSFEVVKVVKGEEFVVPGMKFKTLLVGKYELGQEFLVMGVDPPTVSWTTPMKASDRVVKYIEDLQKLPPEGADRLFFFQQYFEDSESILAFDAYDEFAQADYKDLIELKDRMDREQLIKWITDPETSVNRRRLYFTMLGVCGTNEDIKVLEELISSGDRKKQAGLDALIACYLNLKKVDGVDLIEKEFLSNTECDYVDTLAAVSALRFHGTEVDFIPKDRIVAAVRLLLDRPTMADMIIPDLARWEDWTVVDKLVKMFKEADEETNWLRVPVVNYLRACPLPEAKKHIEELRKIDADAVRRAEFFADFDDADFDDDDAEDDGEMDEAGGGVEDDSNEAGESDDVGQKVTADVSTKFVTTPIAGATARTTVLKVPTEDPANQPAPDSGLSAEDEKLLSNEIPAINDQNVTSIPSEFTDSTNRESVQPVSSTVDASSRTNETAAQVAQSSRDVAPVAQSSTMYNHTGAIIFVPMLVSAGIFVLLWSVIHGWFQRLIF